MDGRTYGRTDVRTDIFPPSNIRSTFGSRPKNALILFSNDQIHFNNYNVTELLCIGAVVHCVGLSFLKRDIKHFNICTKLLYINRKPEHVIYTITIKLCIMLRAKNMRNIGLSHSFSQSHHYCQVH